ncbi:MAG: GNAT family N-acetyltransferase [Armatimonadota bacterium]
MQLFETERLYARRLTLSDIEPMLSIYGDIETVRFVGDSSPITREECLQWVEVTNSNFLLRGYGMVAFCNQETDEVIGCGGIVHPGQQDQPEIKYAFRRNCWGQGYATEAITALVQFAQSNWNVGEMIATVAPGNSASQHVLSKLGFIHVEDQTNEDASITQVWAIKAQS